MHANIKGTLQPEFVSKPALMLLGALLINLLKACFYQGKVFQEGISALTFVSTTSTAFYLLPARYSPSIFQGKLDNNPLIPPWNSNPPHNCLLHSFKLPSLLKN